MCQDKEDVLYVAVEGLEMIVRGYRGLLVGFVIGKRKAPQRVSERLRVKCIY